MAIYTRENIGSTHKDFIKIEGRQGEFTQVIFRVKSTGQIAAQFTGAFAKALANRLQMTFKQGTVEDISLS
jgi:hypothetical protein